MHALNLQLEPMRLLALLELLWLPRRRCLLPLLEMPRVQALRKQPGVLRPQAFQGLQCKLPEVLCQEAFRRQPQPLLELPKVLCQHACRKQPRLLRQRAFLELPRVLCQQAL